MAAEARPGSPRGAPALPSHAVVGPDPRARPRKAHPASSEATAGGEPVGEGRPFGGAASGGPRAPWWEATGDRPPALTPRPLLLPSRTVRPRRLRVPSSVALALAATAPLPSPPLSPRGGSASDDAPSDASSAPARRRAAASARRRVPHPARPRGAPAGVDRAAAAAGRRRRGGARRVGRVGRRARQVQAGGGRTGGGRSRRPRRRGCRAGRVGPAPQAAALVCRRRRPRALPPRRHPLAGARLAVFSPGDGAFFRATVREVGGRLPPGSALLEYEDGKEELADLGGRRFRLLTPRASSAGCGAGLLAAALALGAEGVRVEPDAPSPPPATCGPPAGPESARRGAALLLRSPGSASWLRADVVGVAPAARRVRVLYEDGEDEWVDLAAEAARGDAQRRARRAAARRRPSAGFETAVRPRGCRVARRALLGR